jgi:hypothetical protein
VSSLAVRTTCGAYYPSDSRCDDSGGNSSQCLSVMDTLKTCNHDASSKLVILESARPPHTSSWRDRERARIPSIMLPGLFMNFPAGQLVPATPKAAASPSAFPMPVSEADEPDVWNAPTPKFFNGQHKQSSIDPTLVSSGPLCVVMMLKYWRSHCTSVSIQSQLFTHFDPYS